MKKLLFVLFVLGISLQSYAGIKEKDVAEAARLSPLVAKIMLPEGIIVSGQPLVGFEQISGPDSISPDRYLFYRT